MGRKMKKATSKKEKPAKAEETLKQETDDPAESAEEVHDNGKSKSSTENGVEDKAEEETKKSEEVTALKGKRKSSAKSKENGVEAEESPSVVENEKKGGRKRGKASKSSSRKTENEATPSKRSKREVKKPELFTPNPDSGKEWEVADIVQKRDRQGRTEYLVRWKGYKLSDATWEPESNLLNCRRMLEKFNSK